jgi:hypothetical protein
VGNAGRDGGWPESPVPAAEDAEEADAESAERRRGLVWRGEGRPFGCMMKYPRSRTGQTASRSLERAQAPTPIPPSTKHQAGPAQTDAPSLPYHPYLLLNLRCSFSRNQDPILRHINSFINSNSVLTAFDIFHSQPSPSTAYLIAPAGIC